MTKLNSINSPLRGKIWTYPGCLSLLLTICYISSKFSQESSTDHRNTKFYDPITQDSPLLSPHNSFHHKNYSNITHNILPNYWPNENLVQSFLHNLIHKNHQQLILTSLYHNSRNTHFNSFLPRQKFHLLLLKTQFRQRRFFLTHELEKFTNSTPTNFHSSKHPLLHHFTTSHHQTLWEIRKLHATSFGSVTVCSERFLNTISQLSNSSKYTVKLELTPLRNYSVFQIPSLHCSQARLNVCLSTGDSETKSSTRGFGIPWKTKSWMPGMYNIHSVSPTLDTPTPATPHCYYPIPFVPCELPFVLVFACAAKTVQTLCRDPSQPLGVPTSPPTGPSTGPPTSPPTGPPTRHPTPICAPSSTQPYQR